MRKWKDQQDILPAKYWVSKARMFHQLEAGHKSNKRHIAASQINVINPGVVLLDCKVRGKLGRYNVNSTQASDFD